MSIKYARFIVSKEIKHHISFFEQENTRQNILLVSNKGAFERGERRYFDWEEKSILFLRKKNSEIHTNALNVRNN
jgi:hypothetical protein